MPGIFMTSAQHSSFTLTSNSAWTINCSHLIYSNSEVHCSFKSTYILNNQLNYLNIDKGEEDISTRLNLFKLSLTP